MKNKSVYIIAFILSVGICSCADDKGNYDYQRLNTITILGLSPDSTFYVDQNDVLRVGGVKLDFAIDKTDRLKYEWYVAGELVGTEPDCGGVVNEIPGNYEAYLCITDVDTELKYYADFRVQVSTVYAHALWVLSEMADGTAKLSVQRRDEAGASLVDDVFERNNPDFGPMGRKPVQLTTIDRGADMNSVFVFCQEGERRIMKIDRNSALFLQGWNSSMAGVEDLRPVRFSNEMAAGMLTTTDGRLFNFNYSSLGELYDNTAEGYYFSWAGVSPDRAQELYIAYDENTDAFYTLKPKGNPFLFSDVKAFDTNVKTDGLTYLTCGTKNADEYGMAKTMCPVLYDPKTGIEHYYEFTSELIFLDYDPWYMYIDVCTEKMQRLHTIGEQGLALVSNEDYWYAAKDNKLIRFHFSNNSEIVDWTEELEGEITALMFDFWKTQNRIFVATYDGSKGYIHEFSLKNAKQELSTPLEVEGRVVCMSMTGNWKY